jgi:hypothetical protein
MSKLRPVELAERLREELKSSPHARDRLLARILSLEIPRLKVRKRGKQNQADFELCLVVISGVTNGIWKSELEACDFIAENGMLSGAGTVKSRALRLYQTVVSQRELIVALGIAHLGAIRAATRCKGPPGVLVTPQPLRFYRSFPRAGSPPDT